MDFACRDIDFHISNYYRIQKRHKHTLGLPTRCGVTTNMSKVTCVCEKRPTKEAYISFKRPMKENYWLCLIPHGLGQIFSLTHTHTTHTHTHTRHDLIRVLRREKESVYPSHTQHIDIFSTHTHTHMRTHSQRTFLTDLPNLSRAIWTIKSIPCAQCRQ